MKLTQDFLFKNLKTPIVAIIIFSFAAGTRLFLGMMLVEGLSLQWPRLLGLIMLIII